MKKNNEISPLHGVLQHGESAGIANGKMFWKTAGDITGAVASLEPKANRVVRVKNSKAMLGEPGQPYVVGKRLGC